MVYPKVFIIILNWNGLQDTLECLESVYNLEYSNFEVVVVDNGSSDDSVKVIHEAYPQATLIENKENLGFTGGNNIAMRYAMQHSADYMWLLNNDTIVETNTLNTLVTAAEKSMDIGLVSPTIFYYGEPKEVQFCGSYVDWENYTVVHPENRNSHVNDDFKIGKNVCLLGTALLIKRNVVEKGGYLDEKYFAYWEDMEYSIRTIKAGYRNIICSSAKIYHKAPLPSSEIIGRGEHYFYYMSRNKYFWGMQHLKGLDRLSFLRIYLSDIIKIAVSCKRCNENEAAEACLEGAWAAILGIGGPWDKSISMPDSLKKIFNFFCSWHPYFLADLIRGDFLNIYSEVLKKTRGKITKIEG